MANPKAKKSKPNITDWIQSVMAVFGTLFALVGLILAWSSLTKSDADLQHQISKLDTIATQSLEHTRLLTKQLAFFKEELDFHKLSLSHRKKEVEPKLIIELEDYNGDIVTAKLINNGKIARIIKIVENKPNDFIIDIPHVYIGESKELPISFRYKNTQEGNNNAILNFTITYEDIDKKINSKIFRFKNLEDIINKKNKNQIERA